MYEDYYAHQAGGGSMPVFAGARYQRGHGLGSILSGLFRRVLPFFKANGKNIASNLLKTGAEVAGDVLEGRKKFGDSLKERVPQGIKRTAQSLKFQSGSGYGKRRKVSRKKKKKNTKRDIFGRNGFRSRAVL